MGACRRCQGGMSGCKLPLSPGALGVQTCPARRPQRPLPPSCRSVVGVVAKLRATLRDQSLRCAAWSGGVLAQRCGGLLIITMHCDAAPSSACRPCMHACVCHVSRAWPLDPTIQGFRKPSLPTPPPSEFLLSPPNIPTVGVAQRHAAGTHALTHAEGPGPPGKTPGRTRAWCCCSWLCGG